MSTAPDDRPVPMVVLNLKVPEEGKALIKAAALIAESPSMSDWARVVLLSAARRELREFRAQQRRSQADGGSPTQSPSRRATLGVHRVANGEVHASGCVHPTPARVQEVSVERCSLCGTVTHRR